ncbi:hypothetical protein [Sphingomonas sp. HMP6]|uniref:hypothetical protein n=1 Tax=Sphingomonas sp. HMP6 TaxID=1517551 RepID=UPI001596E78C|nr:hypothetical protein [Sphingomonas sp. HMP6]BCA57408.1 hypothetical protein HMP06_0177 [Sphingomonas sp. HMP6]
MTRLEPAMPNKDLGPGEAADRARSRRTAINFTILALLGGVVGFTAALVEQPDAPISAGGTIPAWFAILAATVFVVAVVAGSVAYYRNMDELQRLDNYWATTVGANVFLLAYPVWLVLWKGGLVPAPDAMILYLVVLATTMTAYFWRKLR